MENDDREYENEESENEEYESDSSDSDCDEKESLATLCSEVDLLKTTSCCVHEMLENAQDYSSAIRNIEEHVEECQRWLKYATSNVQRGFLDKRLERRKNRLKPYALKELHDCSLQKINKFFGKQPDPASLSGKWKFRSPSEVCEQFTVGHKCHLIINHPLECPKREIGERVGIYSILAGVTAQGIVEFALPSVASYRVNVVFSWGPVKLGQHVFHGHELVGAAQKECDECGELFFAVHVCQTKKSDLTVF